MAIRIPIISEFDPKGIAKAKAEFATLEGAGSKSMFMLQKAILPAAAAIGSFTAIIAPAIRAASDFEESASKVDVIFGRASKSVLDFASDAAVALGQSKNDVLAAAGVFGTFGKAAGLAGEDLALFTTDFVALATDLASFNNTSPEEAVNAIGAALRGESEPLRRFGILLDDATLKAEATTLGIYKGNKALTAQQKILAAQSAIYKQSGDAQGDFARTSDGLANSQRTLSALFENFQIQLGQKLLPATTDFVNGLIDIKNAMDNIPGPSEKATEKVNLFVKLLQSATNPIIGFINGVKLLGSGFFDAEEKTGAYNQALGISAQQQMRAGDAAAEFNKKLKETPPAATGAKKEVESFAKALKEKLAEAVDTAKDKLADAKKEFADFASSVSSSLKSSLNFADGLNKGKEALIKTKNALQDAQKEFDNFSRSTSDAITGAFNFQDANLAGIATGKGFISGLQDAADNAIQFADRIQSLLSMKLSKNALKMVLAAGQEAGTYIADELINGGQAAIEKTNALVEATQAAADAVGMNAASEWYQTGIDSANAMGTGFLDGLNDQINGPDGIIAYIKNIQDLLDQGLSQESLGLVLQSGFEAGSAIAKELIAGGTTAIDQTNALVKSANTAADKVGINAAIKWYQAGVNSAQKMVDGLTAELDLMTPKLMKKMDEIAAKMKRKVNIDVVITERVSRIISTISGEIPKMANGGIVNRPTLALIGEAGPEAVVPLSKMGGMGGGGDININVNGGMATSAEIGQSILNALRAYQRSAGPLNLNIA